ncbi:hypothetical protein N0V90_002059 [Kalmusia sp. IMI 367209]|nr:hypothetical protein N0V90_002059 [Kalmusia sp. IMI 367209]
MSHSDGQDEFRSTWSSQAKLWSEKEYSIHQCFQTWPKDFEDLKNYINKYVERFSSLDLKHTWKNLQDYDVWLEGLPRQDSQSKPDENNTPYETRYKQKIFDFMVEIARELGKDPHSLVHPAELRYYLLGLAGKQRWDWPAKGKELEIFDSKKTPFAKREKLFFRTYNDQNIDWHAYASCGRSLNKVQNLTVFAFDHKAR